MAVPGSRPAAVNSVGSLCGRLFGASFGAGTPESGPGRPWACGAHTLAWELGCTEGTSHKCSTAAGQRPAPPGRGHSQAPCDCLGETYGSSADQHSLDASQTHERSLTFLLAAGTIRREVEDALGKLGGRKGLTRKDLVRLQTDVGPLASVAGGAGCERLRILAAGPAWGWRAALESRDDPPFS